MAAALELFARHGFQRTSMAQVAESAGISRATLYARFRDKRALFEGLATGLVADALRLAREAWLPEADLAANLEAAILAKDLPLHHLRHASAHGADVLASNVTSVQQHGRVLEAGFVEFLTARAIAAEAEGANFAAFGGAAAFATFVSLAAAGFKEAASAEPAYRQAVRTFAAVAAAAVGIGP